MGVREDLEETKQSFAMEMLEYSKEQQRISNDNLDKANKRLVGIIIVLIVLLGLTIGAFVYYVNTTGFEITTKEATSEDGGNACAGDNCNNGEINYGESKDNNKKKS